MNFSKEYIEICRKLPPRKPGDWEVGDFLRAKVNIKTSDGFKEVEMTMMIVHTFLERLECVDETANRKLWTIYKGKDITWLPHRISQFMKMKEWNSDWILSTDDIDKYWHIGHIDRSTPCDQCHEFPIRSVIADAEDPLLACAKAIEPYLEGIS